MKMRIGFALICLILTSSGCATIFGGYRTTAIIRTSSPELQFFDSTNSPLNAKRAIVDSNIQYSFTLDKRKKYHDVRFVDPSRSGLLRIQRDVNYIWWLPNLFSYGLGGLVDLATEAIYYFPPVRLSLDTVGVGRGSSLPLSHYPREVDERFKLGLHVGIVHPVHQAPVMFTSAGANGGVNVWKGLWASLGYSSARGVEQHLGPEKRPYVASLQMLEIGIDYYPHKYLITSLSLAYNHFRFDRAFNNQSGPEGFSRNSAGIGFGIGISASSVLVQWKRYLGFKRINTPLGEGHAISIDQLRLGVDLKFDRPR